MSRIALVLCAIFSCACSSGVSDDPALGALLRIDNAQFVAGPTPGGVNGPQVASLELLNDRIWAGEPDKALRGALDENATAVTLALSSDSGYWIVPAGVPDVSAPSLPTFSAVAAFSHEISANSYTLEARAVDAGNNFGPPLRETLTVLDGPPMTSASGVLVVKLTWDSESDLDLHVVEPSGNEIYHGAPTSLDAFNPGTAEGSDGLLDFDSNANCVIDGLRREDVTWAEPPPSGHYLVRVDTASLCSTPSAHWVVEVRLNETVIGAASGLSLDSDTRGAHDRGAGVLALGFDVP